MNLDNIFPLIVPFDYYNERAKKMCHYKLANDAFVLTWIIIDGEEPMEFVTPYLFNTMVRRMPGWETQTFENLRLSINENEISFTQHKMSADGKRILFIVFLNVDGLGSSRVMLGYELNIAFPNGYYIALPDKTCGMVIAKDVTKKELEQTQKMVLKTFQHATTPLSGALHTPAEFALPEAWVLPGDEEFSREMTDEILNLRGK